MIIDTINFITRTNELFKYMGVRNTFIFYTAFYLIAKYL